MTYNAMWLIQPLHNTRDGQYNKCMQLIPHGTSHVPTCCHTMEGSKPWYLCFWYTVCTYVQSL